MSKLTMELDVPEDLATYASDLGTIFSGMIDLLVRKRQAYGPVKNLVRFGEAGLVIRASDKIDRLWNMAQKGTSLAGDGEGRDDAWRDLIGYAALALLPETKKLLGEASGG